MQDKKCFHYPVSGKDPFARFMNSWRKPQMVDGTGNEELCVRCGVYICRSPLHWLVDTAIATGFWLMVGCVVPLVSAFSVAGLLYWAILVLSTAPVFYYLHFMLAVIIPWKEADDMSDDDVEGRTVQSKRAAIMLLGACLAYRIMPIVGWR